MPSLRSWPALHPILLLLFLQTQEKHLLSWRKTDIDQRTSVISCNPKRLSPVWQSSERDGKGKKWVQERIGLPGRLKQLVIELCYWVVHWAPKSYCIAPKNIEQESRRDLFKLKPLSPLQLKKIFFGKSTWQSYNDICKGHPFSHFPSIIDHFTVICSVTWPLNGSKACLCSKRSCTSRTK